MIVDHSTGEESQDRTGRQVLRVAASIAVTRVDQGTSVAAVAANRTGATFPPSVRGPGTSCRLVKGMHMPLRIQPRVSAAVLLAAVGGLALGSVTVGPAGAAMATSARPSTLQILVTNDDGVGAPGINAAVNALKALPNTKVTVVAPLTNQSGTGPKVTDGTLAVTSATTSSGYPAKAVAGYPADTIIWAIDDHGVTQRPNLVVSGINNGQNVGPLASLSGTVGAAETALARGIPALAVSQGVDNGLPANFSQGAKQLVTWVQAHRKQLLSAKKGVATSVNGNLNVPTCANGHIRGPVRVPLASTLSGYNISTVNCSSKAINPANDIAAFVVGFAALAPMQPVNPPANSNNG
jgi:5'-nucleotidase